MRYFLRTNRLANWLFAISALLLVISVGYLLGSSALDQVFQYSNGNFVRAGIIFALLFLPSIVCSVMGIALKCIVRDAMEEFNAVQQNLER